MAKDSTIAKSAVKQTASVAKVTKSETDKNVTRSGKPPVTEKKTANTKGASDNVPKNKDSCPKKGDNKLQASTNVVEKISYTVQSKPVATSQKAPSKPVATSQKAPSKPVATSQKAPSKPVATSQKAPSKPVTTSQSVKLEQKLKSASVKSHSKAGSAPKKTAQKSDVQMTAALSKTSPNVPVMVGKKTQLIASNFAKKKPQKSETCKLMRKMEGSPSKKAVSAEKRSQTNPESMGKRVSKKLESSDKTKSSKRIDNLIRKPTAASSKKSSNLVKADVRQKKNTTVTKKVNDKTIGKSRIAASANTGQKKKLLLTKSPAALLLEQKAKKKRMEQEARLAKEKDQAEMAKLQLNLKCSVIGVIKSMKSIPEMKIFDMKYKLLSVKEFSHQGHKAILVYIPGFQDDKILSIKYQVICCLEKALQKTVFIVGKRKIIPKQAKRSPKPYTHRPMSHTLTAVHASVMNDLVFPSEVMGKRTIYNQNGSKIHKVYLDISMREKLETRIPIIHHLYKELTGQDVNFGFYIYDDPMRAQMFQRTRIARQATTTPISVR